MMGKADIIKLAFVLLVSALQASVAACVTVTQQVQQRESQAGKMEGVSEDSDADSRESRETDVDLSATVPIK